MTKAELTKVIMAHNTNYKKTNLLRMHIADLEKLAASYVATDHAAAAVNAAAQRPEIDPSLYAQIGAAYDSNIKMVKGPRMDKAYFRQIAIEKATQALAGVTDLDTIETVVKATMEALLSNKTAFCPINETEALMLSTIPKLPDFETLESTMDGKGMLAKVAELHGVEAATTRALMVSLCRKGFYTIKGIKSGQKRTTIQLQERGIRYLIDNGLLETA